jgi:hypothetical protein
MEKTEFRWAIAPLCFLKKKRFIDLPKSTLNPLSNPSKHESKD